MNVESRRSKIKNQKSKILRVILSGRMAVALVMGYACGLPLLLTATVLQAWMKEEGVDLSVIGLMSLVGLPYTLKFCWAPVLDRFTLPFLGRRRGWLLVIQLMLTGAIAAFGLTDPARSPWWVAFVAFWVTFLSASQDVVADAYRREDLPDAELGLGSSIFVNGYRVGMLLSSAGGLILADHVSYPAVYGIMAACMIPGMVTTLLAREPAVFEKPPQSLREAVVGPLKDYFGRPNPFWILAFILFYKIGDTMAASMTTPFYLDMGFSKTEIGSVVKLFGFWATVGGSLLGGVLILRWGIGTCLLAFGLLQAVSTAGFAVLAGIGHSLLALAAVITFENATGGMGTSAYVAFMASMTTRKFTATQYALLSSLMGVPRVLASAPTGFMVVVMGWAPFFILCTAMAVPGLLLLRKVNLSQMRKDAKGKKIVLSVLGVSAREK